MIDALDLLVENEKIADLDPASRRLWLRSHVLEKNPAGHETIESLANAIDGYGILTPLIEDERVTDVLVNGADDIWVERSGRLDRVDLAFPSTDALNALIERLFGEAGVRIDIARPIADARLRDGSRIHAVLPPVAPRGPLVSIRRHRRTWPTIDELVGSTLTADEAGRLRAAVAERSTIVISGPTGAGKTTLLNSLLCCVTESERVVVIEETPELRLSCAHWVSLVARSPGSEGKGGVDLDELVLAALRMRPDRIVVGEVRGSESATALKAMSVGHEGSMVTVHARSAPQALERLTELAMAARTVGRQESVRAQVDRSVDLVVHLERRDGARRVVEIFDAQR